MKLKVNWSEQDMEVAHSGKVITLPDDPDKMPIGEAIDALYRKQEQDEKSFHVVEWIKGAHPLDAMVAFMKAVKTLYGFASFKDTPSFWGPEPPSFISIQIGIKNTDRIQVPLGSLKLPGMESSITTAIHRPSRQDPEMFVLYGDIKNKEKKILLDLANETRRIVALESIYKGKALSVTVNDEGDLNHSIPPEFMDVSDVTEASVLFDSEIQAQVTTNILTPIKKTAEVIKHGIPLGRGILLEGPFGTGKSLTAKVTAGVCQEHGWTFVLLDNVKGMKQALEFAQRYAPAVLFAEDVDRVLEHRDERANDLINTISGVSARREQVMIVLTTNFVEKIDKSLLRPGRLDAVISLRAPNANTVEKLIRHYGKGLIKEDCDLTEASVELSGQIPAVIREALERSKLSMIDRGDVVVTAEDIIISAKTMKNHIALLNGPTKTETLGDRLVNELREVLDPEGKIKSYFE